MGGKEWGGEGGEEKEREGPTSKEGKEMAGEGGERREGKGRKG